MRPRRLIIAGGVGEIAFLDLGPVHRPVDVVFCHANGINAGAYRCVLASAASSLRIWAIDQRGRGATTLPADPDQRVGWTELQRRSGGVPRGRRGASGYPSGPFHGRYR